MAEREIGKEEDDQEVWEADHLLELAGHDLLNQQQAALGFLQLLETSGGLSEGELGLVDRTVEALEQTGRLLLQMRTALVQREVGPYAPGRVDLDQAVQVAARAVEGAFVRDRLAIDTRGLEGGHWVLADHMLSEMLTQLFLLLAEPAPPDRNCALMVSVGPSGTMMRLQVQSEGFALNPMVTDALTQDRGPHGRTRDTVTVGLVTHLLERYCGDARMEPAPPGGVGAHLVIELPSEEGADAVHHDSR